MEDKFKKFSKISNFKILALCVLIIIIIVYYYEDFKENKVEIPTIDIVVLKSDITENTIINKDMIIIEKKYKEDVIKENNIAMKFDDVVGKRSKVPIYKGESIKLDRLLKNETYMNDKENSKEISFELNEVDKALNLKKDAFIDIWLEPVDTKSGVLPQKLFTKLKVKDVVNSYKQIIVENKEYNETDGKIASYLILTLTDIQIDTLYNIDKTVNNIKIAKYKDNDFYNIINQTIQKEGDEN